jgi:pimeloyl-ACP methyl ester carboxylesterase
MLHLSIDVGHGEPVVMLPGFALSPRVYRATAELLASRGSFRVVMPELYRVSGDWTCEAVTDGLLAALDEQRFARVTMIAHSFAGAAQLEFATRWPDRIVELVFCDTLAVRREWRLAREAMRHPLGLLRMATPNAATSFATTVITHPRDIVQAAWWGFTNGRTEESAELVSDGVPAHVLWANRDSILSQRDGRAFAEELGASFDVVHEPNGRPIDHDWMYRHPELFVAQLEALRLVAWRRSFSDR